MKKIITLVLAATLLTTGLFGCSKNDGASGSQSKPQTSSGASSEVDSQTNVDLLSGKHHAEMKIKDYGTISLELDADKAPITVTNFVNLANDGFYDGLTFHRVISGFMIQGGDPSGNGTGGSEQTIKGEFTSNGVENDIAHVRGIISMARSAAKDSASSQFFIMHADAPHLDGEYAAFGHVTEGIEIVDAICEKTPTQNEMVAAEDQPVIESVTIID